MKFKSLFIIGLLLLTICSISSIYADTFVTENSTFSLPDGYTLSEKDNYVMLYNDKYVLTLHEGPYINTQQMKENLIDMGYTFIGEKDYDYNGVDINQQNYNNDGVNTCVYSFEKNGQNYIVSLNVYDYQDIPEYDENPVTHLIDSLEKNS